MLSRSRVFDTYVSDALRMLDKAALTRPLHTPLEQAAIVGVRRVIENAFLPNMRGGRATTPQEYEGTENIALLPLSVREFRKGVNLHPSMLQLTPSRLLHIAQALRERNPLLAETDAARRAQEIRLVALATARAEENALVPRGLAYCWTRTSTVDNLAITTRPIIFVRDSPLVNSHRTNRAVTIGHEGLHGYDYEAEPCTPPQTSNVERKAWLELRAYHLGHRIVAATGAENARAPFASVEDVRLQHNTDPAQPFATPPALVAELEQMGAI